MEDLRLPSIQTSQNPMYEEFDFLKKMVFDPEFLSQHARYILKFEKMTKKFNKKNGINIRNHKLRNKIKFKNGELKPLHNNKDIHPGFVQTTYDKDINRITFNKSKMNTKTSNKGISEIYLAPILFFLVFFLILTYAVII